MRQVAVADGRIVGGWAQRAGGEIVYRLLEDIGSEAATAVAARAAALGTWIGSIAISVALNALRKVKRFRQREVSLDDAAEIGRTTREAEPDLKTRLHGAIDALRGMRDGLDQHTSITKEQRERYLNFVSEARKEYDEWACSSA